MAELFLRLLRIGLSQRGVLLSWGISSGRRRCSVWGPSMTSKAAELLGAHNDPRTSYSRNSQRVQTSLQNTSPRGLRSHRNIFLWHLDRRGIMNSMQGHVRQGHRLIHAQTAHPIRRREKGLHPHIGTAWAWPSRVLNNVLKNDIIVPVELTPQHFDQDASSKLGLASSSRADKKLFFLLRRI